MPELIRPDPALATIQDNEWPNVVDPYGAMRVALATGLVLQLAWFVLVLGNRLWGVDLRGRQRQYPANRLDTSGVPLLGGLTRETLIARFSAAILLGQLVMVRNMLMLPIQQRMQRPPGLILASNRNFEWEVGDKFKPVNLSEVPTVAQLLRLPPVGTAWLNQDNELLIILSPAFIEPHFR
jgi:hypothetical protein